VLSVGVHCDRVDHSVRAAEFRQPIPQGCGGRAVPCSIFQKLFQSSAYRRDIKARLLGVTLLLSSRMRSSMGILAIIAAIVIVPMMMSNLHNNVANHILFLFSYLALDANNFFDMVSYSIGPLVIEYPVALAIFYAALFVVGIVLSRR
jgi:hypothetical protein